MRRAIALGLFVVACGHVQPLSVVGELDPDEPFRYTLDVDVFKLRNGLTVVLAPQVGTHLVSVDMRYEVGDADDPPGKRGLADLVRADTWYGRAATGQPTLGQRISAAAMDFNGGTLDDSTDVGAIALADRLPELLDVEAVRLALTCDQIDAAELEHARAENAEMNLHAQTDTLDPALPAIFGASHPYGHTAREAGLSSITRDDVCAFLDAHYAPDRAILVVSGDFDRKVVRAAIVGRFGHPGRHGVAPVAIPPMAPPTGELVTIPSSDDHTELVLAFPRPRFGTRDALYDEAARAIVLDQLEKLDHERDDMVGTFQTFVGDRAGGATTFEIFLRPDSDAAAVAKAVQARLDGAADLADFRADTFQSFATARLLATYDNPSERDQMIADYMQYTGDASLHLVDLDRITKLDAPQIVDYVRDHFARGPHATILLAPSGKASTALPTTAVPSAIDDEDVDDPASADIPMTIPKGTQLAYDEMHLDNGLRVIFAPRPTSAMFSAVLRFPTGTLDDPDGATGTASLAARGLRIDLTSGRGSMGRRDRWAALRAGSSLDARVTSRETTFMSSGVASFADWHLWSLHAYVENGRYDESRIAEANRAPLEDKRNRGSIESLGRLFGAEQVRTLRGRHVDLEGLEAFRRAHYRARGATLIIAGNFDRARIEAEVRDLFGGWTGDPPPAPRVANLAGAPGPAYLVEDDDTMAHVQVWITFRTRSSRSDQAAVRPVGEYIVIERLRAATSDAPFAFDTFPGYRSDLDADAYGLDITLDPATAGPTLQRIMHELAELHDHGASMKVELARARRRALFWPMMANVSAARAATEAGWLVEAGEPLDRLITLPAQIAAVRPDDVGALFAEDLDPKGMVVYISGPGAHAAAEAAGLGPITTVGK